MLTLQAKLLIAAVFAAFIGYTYYWTYDQGRKNGATSELAAQVKIQAKALAEQDAEFRKTRAKEMAEAAEHAKNFASYHKRMVGVYEKTIDNLKNQPHQECLTLPVDTEYLSLRNSARGYDSPEGEVRAVPSGTDEKVRSPA